MKKQILTLALGNLLLSGIANGEPYGEQLPNSTFEEWETETSYDESVTGKEPVGWNSFITLHKGFNLANMALSTEQLVQSEDVRPGSEGSLSAKVSARNAGVGVLKVIANGNLTTGIINAGNTSATAYESNFNYSDPADSKSVVPFTSKPDSIAVWVKFNQGSLKSDSYPDGGFSIWIHDNNRYQDPTTESIKEQENHLVGKAISKISTVSGTEVTADNKETFDYAEQIQKIGSNTWVRLSVPFTYTDNAVEPVYIFATFKTNNRGGQGNISDILYVDDALLIYNPTLTVEIPASTAFEEEGEIALNYDIKGTMSPYNLNADANQVILEISTDDTFGSSTTLNTLTTDESGTISGSLAGLSVGTYYVRIRTTNYPMKSDPIEISIAEKTNGIKDLMADGNVALFPIPAEDVLYIEGETFETATIYDLNGRWVKTADVREGSIDVAKLNAGVYFMTLQKEGNLSGVKFIKK